MVLFCKLFLQTRTLGAGKQLVKFRQDLAVSIVLSDAL